MPLWKSQTHIIRSRQEQVSFTDITGSCQSSQHQRTNRNKVRKKTSKPDATSAAVALQFQVLRH